MAPNMKSSILVLGFSGDNVHSVSTGRCGFLNGKCGSDIIDPSIPDRKKIQEKGFITS